MAAFSEFGVTQEDMFACVAVELGRAQVDDEAFSIELEEFWNCTIENSLLKDLDKILLIAYFCESFIVRYIFRD